MTCNVHSGSAYDDRVVLQVTRRIFTFNDPSTLLMGVHPSAKNILGEANLAFMHGPAHKVGVDVMLSLAFCHGSQGS